MQVKNVGEGDVGGVAVPLWGVNTANTLLPAVNFTTSFKPCPSKPLPKKFAQGATLSTCLVYLSPDRGTLEAVSYRPEPGVQPDHLDRGPHHPEADADQEGQAQEEGLTAEQPTAPLGRRPPDPPAAVSGPRAGPRRAPGGGLT